MNGCALFIPPPAHRAVPLVTPEVGDRTTDNFDVDHTAGGAATGSERARDIAEACRGADATGNLGTDAHLAALAVEHGCELASTDTDFGKFSGLRWINPLATLATP